MVVEGRLGVAQPELRVLQVLRVQLGQLAQQGQQEQLVIPVQRAQQDLLLHIYSMEETHIQHISSGLHLIVERLYNICNCIYENYHIVAHIIY
jgi:hypothetical protein